jgi:hypothetical protein
MENKTALQQLIEELSIVNPHSVGQVILMVKHYLKTEKEQICDAYFQGIGFCLNEREGTGDTDDASAEFYFTETFKQ